MKKLIPFALALFLFTKINAQQLYFPPLTGITWDTLSPAELGWCTQYLDTLDDLLVQTNTKAIIILKDGKIVHEKYFGTFRQDSLWYWASAGKSLTSVLVGIAQQEGYLLINDTSSKYLGTGWTSCTPEQEAAITVRNQLTMTTGLDDGVPDKDCTLDTCLVYLADPGTRWAYHNGPYTRLDGVISGATGLNLNTFLLTRIKQKTGMDGIYYQSGYNNVFVSTARSMARFGLLMLNKGYWNTTAVLSDTAYFNAMTNTSQNLNLSYGYLWWLNGKTTHMIPQSQFVFNGPIVPNGPADMFCALGKNDQKVHVVPSKNLVVIRMGEAAYANELVPLRLDDDMWVVLNKLMCTQTAITEPLTDADITVYPNPVTDVLHINLPTSTYNVTIYNAVGQIIYTSKSVSNINVSTIGFTKGTYVAEVVNATTGKTYRAKFVK